MLEELASSVKKLERAGCPFALEDVGIQKEDVLLPLRNVRLLRRRYSRFDLAYELGLEGTLLRD